MRSLPCSSSSWSSASTWSSLYNGLVQKRNRVDNAWAQIDVQLKRRRDLIPNLVETVKGYAAHERGTFEAVTQARAAAAAAQRPAEVGAAEGMLEPGARAAVRGRRGLPGAEGEPELPRPAGAAARHRGQDRGLAPGLQRHGADLQQRDPGLPGGAARRRARVLEAGVLRDRGRRRPRGAGGQLPAGGRRAAVDAPERVAPRRSSPRVLRRSRSPAPRPRSRSRCSRPTSHVHVAKDGTLLVDEHIQYAFSRPVLAAATATIPVRTGESVSDVAVLENGRRYRPGGCTELGCADAAGHVRRRATSTAGRASSGTTAPLDEARTFEIRYTLRGVAVAYDDVVDVNLQGLGRRVEGGPRPADRDARRARARSCAPGATRSGCAATCSSPASSVAAARARRPGAPVRRAARARPALGVHLDRRDAASSHGNGLAKIVGDGAGRRGGATSATTTGSSTPSTTRGCYVLYVLAARRSCRRCSSSLGVYWLFGRELAHRLRPRVRAGAADRHGAGARADAAAPGRRGRARSSSRRRSST